MINLILIQLAVYLAIMAAGTAGITVIVRTWMRHRHSLNDEQVRDLFNMIYEIRDSLEELRTEQDASGQKFNRQMGEISGRVEFVERLLTRESAANPSPPDGVH